MRNALTTMAAAVIAAAAFGYDNPLAITDSSVTELSDAQKTELNGNTYDALVINNGQVVTVSGIGSFNGDIVIKSGSVMKGTGTTCVGTATGKTIVESGGSFYYYRALTTDFPASPNNEKYEIAGSGCGDYGALYYQGVAGNYDANKPIFYDVTLKAESKVSSVGGGSQGRFNLFGVLDQGGYKLTVACYEPHFSPTSWKNPANVETINGYFHAGTIWNTVYKEGLTLIWNGGSWSSYGQNALVWPIVMKKTASFSLGSSKATSPESTINNFKGLLTIESGVTLTLEDWSGGAGRFYFSGGIAGEGTIKGNYSSGDLFYIGDVSDSVLVWNYRSGCIMHVYGKITGSAKLQVSTGASLYVDGVENDYTGLTKTYGGRIFFKGDGSFPTNDFTSATAEDRLSVDNGGSIELSLKCEGDTEGFTLAGIKAIIEPAAAAKIKNLHVTVPEGKSWEYSYDISGSGYDTYFVALGSLTLSGTFSNGYNPVFSSSTGKTILTKGYAEGEEAPDGLNAVPSGEVVFCGNFRHVAPAGHTKNLTIGKENGALAIVRVKDNAKLVSVQHRNGHASQPSAASVAAGTNARAILEIDDNAVFSNKLVIASSYEGCVGAVYQRGGTVVSPRASADMSWSDKANSESYYDLQAGYYEIGYWMRQGINPSGVGMFYQRGGSFKVANGRFIPCIRGTGVVYQTSGTYNAGSSENDIGYGEWSSWLPGGFCNWTVSGANAKYVGSNSIILGHHDGSTHIVNINDGGCMQPTQIVASQTNVNAVGILNFNGGVLSPYSQTPLGNQNNSGQYGQPTVYVYGGGMTYDSSRLTSSTQKIYANLLAPTGKGVKSIAMPASMPSGYIAPPLVTIEGDGVGATAVAEFDTTNRVVTGITVTSPGCNYTTAHAYFCKGGPTGGADLVECGAVELADNASGGFTKIGAGEVQFYNCANTYTGETYVAAGTLSCYGDEANKAVALTNTPIRIAKGAVLNTNWHAYDFKALGGAGTCVNQEYRANTSLLYFSKQDVEDGGLTFSNTDLSPTHLTGRLKLNDGTVVKITDLDKLDHSKTYPLVTCNNILIVGGSITLSGTGVERWRLVTTSKTLSLRPVNGLMILLR